MSKPDNEERNAQIFDEYIDGQTIDYLAPKYNLSRSRIGQIVLGLSQKSGVKKERSWNFWWKKSDLRQFIKADELTYRMTSFPELRLQINDFRAPAYASIFHGKKQVVQGPMWYLYCWLKGYTEGKNFKEKMPESKRKW